MKTAISSLGKSPRQARGLAPAGGAHIASSAHLFSSQDGVADKFRDLVIYGVAERVEPISSHPCGNPIMPSTHEGQGVPLKSMDKPTCFPISIRRWMDGVEQSPLSLQSEASGVGNNPDAVTSVRGTNGSRRNAFPFRIIPDLGQRPENIAKPSIKQLCAVFHDDVAGSNFANEARLFSPQSASLSVKAKSAARRRKVLAGEPSADDINGNSIGSKSACGKGSNVIVNRNLRPVLGKNLTGKGLDLAEGDGFKAARALKTKGEAANPAEQIKDSQLAHLFAGRGGEEEHLAQRPWSDPRAIRIHAAASCSEDRTSKSANLTATPSIAKWSMMRALQLCGTRRCRHFLHASAFAPSVTATRSTTSQVR